MEIMKRIACPFRARNSFLTAFVAIVALSAMATVATAGPSARPQVGGTLHVQMSERIPTIDPRKWPLDFFQAAASERVDSLVFDRLTKVDDHGMLHPSLAVSWQHDESFKRWEFRLREDVKFSDGTPLTPPVAAMALQQLLGASFDVSATSDSVVIQSEHALPGIPGELASGRYFIFHTGDDNSLAGTGPFRVPKWPAGDGSAQAVFEANLTCWSGRPFVAKIELKMGVDFQQQANAVSFGQADVVELPASEVRRAAQRGVRTASSDPVELFALVADVSRPTLQDAHVRQAISLAIDRASIADVILQRQGLVAGGLLPNWISGYAHLFPAASDLARAKQLLAASGRQLSHFSPLVLFYDSNDVEARTVADRLAVNLREVGIVVQVSGQIADGKTKAPVPDLRLVRRRIGAPDPAEALSGLLTSLGETSGDLENPDQIYAAERAPVDAFRVIPIVHVSESYGLSPQVRDWMPSRWGGWKLEEVWLGPAFGAGGDSP
jgi:peptide/nickel transport system substrate-binding protein